MIDLLLVYDECVVNPCNNGGTCQNQAGSYICTCMPDYTGLFCDERLPSTDEATNIGAIVGGVVGGLAVIVIIAIAIILIIFCIYKGSYSHKPQKAGHEVELAKKGKNL